MTDKPGQKDATGHWMPLEKLKYVQGVPYPVVEIDDKEKRKWDKAIADGSFDLEDRGLGC